jgi:hypothetical protein
VLVSSFSLGYALVCSAVLGSSSCCAVCLHLLSSAELFNDTSSNATTINEVMETK